CASSSIVTPNPQKLKAQAGLVRDIFGNPFRPVAIGPAWLAWNNGTIPAIARRIHEEGADHDLPILADALEDAGCTDAGILGHCRSDERHVRGCWVIELLLPTPRPDRAALTDDADPMDRQHHGPEVRHAEGDRTHRPQGPEQDVRPEPDGANVVTMSPVVYCWGKLLRGLCVVVAC